MLILEFALLPTSSWAFAQPLTFTPFRPGGIYGMNEKAGWTVTGGDAPVHLGAAVAATYSAIGNTGREASYFLNMYLRDSRAIDYIRTARAIPTGRRTIRR